MGSKAWLGIVVSAFLLTGCATGRNSQADIDALNARINALQGQLAEKDEELTKLQNEVADQKLAREAAAMQRVEAPAPKKTSDSYLK
jgi:hypothetical protein